MPLDWLPGVTRTVTGADAGSYVSAPFRIVIHRTEGSTIAGAVAAYRQHNVAPHATVDLARRQVVQHSVFSRAARALQNAAGGVETNRLSCIQFEVIGFSARSGADSDDDLAWFGSTVLAPVMAAYGVQPVAPEFHGPDCGWTLARRDAPQRMAFDAWRRFNGVCGHVHVPENDHWDPGAFRVRTALAAAVPPILPSARPLATKATTTPGDDDMTPDQAQMLAEVHAELLKRLPNRAGPNGQAVKGADGSVTADTVLGFAANSDGYGFRAQARLENLEKSVAELSRALADALARLAH